MGQFLKNIPEPRPERPVQARLSLRRSFLEYQQFRIVMNEICVRELGSPYHTVALRVVDVRSLRLVEYRTFRCGGFVGDVGWKR